MVVSRLDVSEGRLQFLRLALRTRINPTFGASAPEEITAAMVQQWVSTPARELAARSVQIVLAGTRAGARGRRGDAEPRQT